MTVDDNRCVECGTQVADGEPCEFCKRWDEVFLTHDNRRDRALASLRYAADELGYSPSKRDYKNLDIEPTAEAIVYTFGTWNAAKRAAGLKRLGQSERAGGRVKSPHFRAASAQSGEDGYFHHARRDFNTPGAQRQDTDG